MLLAYSTAGNLAATAQICARDDSEHAAHVAELRLASPPDYEVGAALLRRAIEEEPRLSRGGALLASADSSAHHDALHALGFNGPFGGSEQLDSTQSELVFLLRREPGVPPRECSHTAVHVSSIVKWVDFLSLLGFSPSLSFTTSGARAAWMTAPWSEATIELIEVPKLLQQQCAASPAMATATTPQPVPSGAIGLAHLCIDVTPRTTSLCSLLDSLSAESQAKCVAASRAGLGAVRQ